LAGGRASGLELAVRANPFGPTDTTVCAGALIAAGHPGGEIPLARILRRLATAQHAPIPVATERWFDDYLAVLIAPVLDLYVHRGIGVEAHPQNTLLTLDADGLPTDGWYRDSQGYYLAESRAAAVLWAQPDFGVGVSAVFPDELVEARVTYYAVVNSVLSFVGALGAAGLADEDRLLCRVRAMLRRRPRPPDQRDQTQQPDRPDRSDQPDRPDQPDQPAEPAEPDRPDRRALVERLLTAPTLPAKANFLTCVDGRDELVGPVATQSVYVEIPNPLVEVRP
jgi:siderophore synthetase component